MTTIAICWNRANDGEFLELSTLAYNGGSGLIRVYWRDHYDGRCDLGRDREKDGPLPFFKTWREAMAFMLMKPREQCQVPVEALVKRGVFTIDDFDEPNRERPCSEHDRRNR